MSSNIIRLAVNDYEETIDFINLVFSYSHKPHDFPTLLPKLYQPTEQCMSCHYAIRKNGRLRAVVGLFPLTLHSGQQQLKAAGIGAVSTHPYERGTGLMKQLMDACIKDIQTEGYHLSCLGGQRQRYSYYGYEKAGTSMSYVVKKNNIKHCFRGIPESGLRFEKLQAHDNERLAFAKRLHDRQLLYVDRSLDEFYACTNSWNMQPWVILGENDRMVGYLVANGSGNQVNEVVLEGNERLTDAIRAWVTKQTSEGVTFSMPPWALHYCTILGGISEDVMIRESFNFRVMDWPTVLNVLFAVKSAMGQLLDGEMNIGISGYGTVQIKVKGGVAACQQTLTAPDFQYDPLTAMRTLFGPLSPLYVSKVPQQCVPLVSSWFPLPLHCPIQDRI